MGHELGLCGLCDVRSPCLNLIFLVGVVQFRVVSNVCCGEPSESEMLEH